MRNFFEFVQPRPALREFVRLINVFRIDMPAGVEPAPTKLVWPSRYCWLSFSPFDNSLIESSETGAVAAEPRTALIGHSTRIERKRYAGRQWFRCQVQFQPGALHRLTGLSLAELTNAAIDAEPLLPLLSRDVSDRLAEARGVDEMISIVENSLHDWASGARCMRPIDRVVDRMAHGPPLGLDAAASLACLSIRQFRRTFVAPAANVVADRVRCGVPRLPAHGEGIPSAHGTTPWRGFRPRIPVPGAPIRFFIRTGLVDPLFGPGTVSG